MKEALSGAIGVIDDPRPIECITQDILSIRVGEGGVTKIITYPEAGQGGYVPWAAIFKGEFLWKRVDLAGFMVIYKEGEK